MAAKKQKSTAVNQPQKAKFSIELEPEVLAAFDAELGRLRPVVRSRVRLINIILAQRYRLANGALAALQEIVSESELQAGGAVAQHR